MRPSDAPAPLWLRDRSSQITTAAIVLGLLYLGRSVLIPLTLALMLSLLVAPLVRAVRRLGVGRITSVIVTVVALAVLTTAIAAVLAVQILRIAESLPQYETNVQGKLKTLDEVTVGRLRVLTNAASRLIETPDGAGEVPAPSGKAPSATAAPPNVVVLAPREAPARPLHLFARLLRSAWVPVESTGIVLLVLIFVLLEHESLRDRFIRIAGVTDILSTTLALGDASERLSRFFVSQFAVNLGFAVAIGLALSILRVPQAMLLGAVAGVMRFVPYFGVWIAGLCATALAFAVDPGWSLPASTLGTFILLDVVAGQLLEPHLYGHATGLSPLAVVVAAIFWSALWGPVGLILSTPLTLCLVVAGRHVKALRALELLLSDAQALTLPQRFYQRALSGDPHEIIADAREFLKRQPLSAYCDRVLLPALQMGHLDADIGATREDQHLKIRRVIIDVVAALSSDGLKLPRRRPRGTVLEDVSAARWLRQQREQVSGRWQGPLGGLPAGSVVVCSGVASTADDLAAELLVRLLRAQKIDARHFSPGDVGGRPPPGADPDIVSIVYLVSAYPGPERERAEAISKEVRHVVPRAHVVRVFCPGVTASSELFEDARGTDDIATSLEQAVQVCLAWREAHSKDQPEAVNAR